MRSPRLLLLILLAAVTLPLVLAGGCAQQDLYEPPGSPFGRLGTLPLPSENEGVAVIGRHAFVAGGQAGLHSVDFTDPTHPVLVQTLNTLKYSESVEVVRTFVDNQLQDIALVVEGTEGITSYDITDPGNMISFNSGTTAVFGNRICIEQLDDPAEPYIVYLAESWKGVRIFESIPAQAGILAYNGVFAGTNGYAEGLVVKDGYLYVADDQMGLAVIDVRILDLDAVQLVSWCDSPGEALDVEIDGEYAYVADGNAGLAVYHINGGETPVHVAQLPLDGKCRAIAIRDGRAALAAQGAGVHFVDITNPRAPVFLGREITEYAMDLAIASDGFVLIVDRDEGLIIMGGTGPFEDTTPPATVRTLVASPFGQSAIRLDWYMTGDDGMFGTAAGIDIRMADTPIHDEATWNAATPLTDVPLPEEPGTSMSLVVTGLTGNTARHFAMKISDAAGHTSDLSNPASAIPGEGILLVDPGLDIQGGTLNDTFTYEITYVFTSAATIHEVVIDGTPHDMALVEENAGEALYRYQTQLPRGEHDYSFRFGADGTNEVTLPAVSGPVVGALVFNMGSPEITEPTHPDYEAGRDADEWPHVVVFNDSLVTRVSEVTQAEWTAMGLTNPSFFIGDNLPVERIEWPDAVAYCNALSSDEGLTPAYIIDGQIVTWNDAADGWRLPTEAEWEWLARAGTTTAFSGGHITEQVCNVDPVLITQGWYCGSDYSGGIPGTRDVQQLAAGPRGRYDMHGNVWEWCWDWYGDYRQLDTDGDGVVLDPKGAAVGTERVVRGGSWYNYSESCRSANRERRFPDSTDNTVGLRVVRTIFVD